MAWVNVAIGVVFAGAFFAAAARLWNRRPAVMSPKVFTAILAAAFVPMLLCVGVVAFLGLREGDLRLLVPLAVPLLLLVPLLVFFRKVIGRAVVFNVDEESLYDALEGSLDEHGLDHEEQRSRIEVGGHAASIAVNYQAATNSGTVSVRGDDQQDLYPVLEDLRTQLEGRLLPKRSPLAYWYLAFGVLMLATQGILATVMNWE